MKIEDIALLNQNLKNVRAGNGQTKKVGVNFSDIYASLNGQQASQMTNEGTSYEDIFQKASREYGVPVNLLKAVAKAESGFNAKAVSSCGAQGLMQLMPKTADALGVENAFDPEQNIMGGAKYMSQMLKNYNGDTTLALAAYNAGAGNVKKYGGVPPFKETQKYIAKVLGFAGGEIDVSQYRTSGEENQSSDFANEKQSLKGMFMGMSQSGTLTAEMDNSMLDSIISREKTPDEEYITTMFLLNLMEARNRASSVGDVSAEG